MKLIKWIATQTLAMLLCFAPKMLCAQLVFAAQQPADTPYSAVARDANSCLWQRTTYESAPNGQWYPHVHTVNEIATGLNYIGPSGDWIESVEEFDPATNGGWNAIQGQHQAYLPYDIYTGAIEVVTPDGQQLQSRPLGIAYFDGTNGVLLAELTNSIGQQLLANNQIIYTNAFLAAVGTPVTADILCTYRKGGFECDLVLRSQLPLPEAFGLNASNTRLELLTEFFSAPEPIETPALGDPVNGIADTSLAFGAMRMGQGAAFAVNNSAATSPPQQISAPSPVCKTWTQISGQTVLIEQVAFESIAPALQTLPAPAAGTNAVSMNSLRFKAGGFPALPLRRLAKAPSAKNVRLAQVDFKKKPGLVIDYNIVNTSQTNLTLQGDTTYFVTAPVTIQNLTIEGGTVVKYTNSTGPLLSITANSINCMTAPYRPAVFTTLDDDSIGETITNSTGSPSDQSGVAALTVNSTNNTLLHDLRILYTGTYGIEYTGSSPTNVIRDVQIVHFDIGISGGAVNLENVLLSGGGIAIFAGGTALNTTVNSCSYLCSGYSSLLLTNSIIADTSHFTFSSPAVNGSNNGFYNTSGDFGSSTYTNSSSFPFQTAAGGDYYLTNGCNFLNGGTTNIDPTLLADLGQKTVDAPTVYSNVTFSTSMTFKRTVQRDTNAVALGYHYDPLDFVFSGVQANGNLTFTAGTAAGWNNGNTLFGINLTNSMVANFQGTATAPDYWERCNTVQEQDTTGGFGVGGIVGDDDLELYGSISISPVLSLNFTRCAAMADCDNHFRDYGGFLVVQANNSEFYSGNCGGYVISAYFTNCLWDRQEGGQVEGFPGDEWIMRNCTFHGGLLYMARITNYANTLVSVRDCSFDGTTFSLVDGLSSDPAYTDYNYDAYTNASNPFPLSSTNDVVMTNGFNFQTNWFGNYYLPTNSPLTNAGDVAAGQVGLYYFTTHTNQVIQSNSIVDIGYHYVGTDTNGNPLGVSFDGIPDYWAAQYGFPVGVSDGLYGPNADPDGDGLNNLQEYQLGSSPVRPNSQTITINGYAYKQLTSAMANTGQTYDVYYRSNSSAPWRRISSTAPGQSTLTFVKPDAGEGDYIFLDTTDTDGDGLSDGYENWFTYVPEAGILSQCSPQSTQLTCANYADSLNSGLRDGWKVAHGLNPMDNSGTNAASYVLAGDTLTSHQKQTNYDTPPPGHTRADYDPLELTASSSVRPVVTITASQTSPFGDLASFTISRDVGSNGSLSGALTVYYAMGGNLVYGRDYLVDPPPQTTTDGYPRVLLATIPAGQSFVTVTMSLTQKVVPVATQSLTMTLVSYTTAQ